MLARISHPMHTYLLGREKNQSIRSSADTHTNKTRQRQTWSLNANHWAYISIRTKNTHKEANEEPECQSLDLHQHPNLNTHTLEPTANRWTYVGLQPEHTQGWLRHKGLRKKKGARRDQLNLLPTYFIWYEDQGDVVPLRRDKDLA